MSDTLTSVLTKNTHDVFNVSCVRHYYNRPKRLFDVKDGPPKSFMVNGVRHSEMDSVLAKRMRSRSPEYLVVWRGYPLSECTWQPQADVDPWERALFDNRYPAGEDGVTDIEERSPRGTTSNSNTPMTVHPVPMPQPLAPTQLTKYNLRRRV